MKAERTFNLNQLLSLCSMMLLSPMLRLFPAAAAGSAGRDAALCALSALPPVLIYVYFICRFMDRSMPGEGLAELCLRIMGPGPGRALLILFSLWFCLYGGFVLRSGADRLISNIYPYSSPQVFIIVMWLICSIAALCPLLTTVRAAKLALPFVFGVLLFIFAFSLGSVKLKNIAPIGAEGLLPVFKGSLSAVNVLLSVITLSCFFRPFTVREQREGLRLGLWAVFMLILISLVTLAVVGSFGAELTEKLSWPFFALVRNLVFFKTLQRTEALIVALWVLPDFLLVSALLSASQHCLRLSAGERELHKLREKVFCLRGRRLFIPLCCLLCLASALLAAPEPRSLLYWSESLIPGISLFISLILIPGIYIYGLLRQKLS